jgi:hypothetical protein
MGKTGGRDGHPYLSVRMHTDAEVSALAGPVGCGPSRWPCGGPTPCNGIIHTPHRVHVCGRPRADNQPSMRDLPGVRPGHPPIPCLGPRGSRTPDTGHPPSADISGHPVGLHKASADGRGVTRTPGPLARHPQIFSPAQRRRGRRKRREEGGEKSRGKWSGAAGRPRPGHPPIPADTGHPSAYVSGHPSGQVRGVTRPDAVRGHRAPYVSGRPDAPNRGIGHRTPASGKKGGRPGRTPGHQTLVSKCAGEGGDPDAWLFAGRLAFEAWGEGGSHGVVMQMRAHVTAPRQRRGRGGVRRKGPSPTHPFSSHLTLS